MTKKYEKYCSFVQYGLASFRLLQKGRVYPTKSRYGRLTLFEDLVLESLWFSILLLLFWGTGCSNRYSKILSEGTFARLFAEMAVITYTYASEPEQLTAAYEEVMEKYELSEKDLRGALISFEKNPERWLSVIESIGKELEYLSSEGAI